MLRSDRITEDIDGFSPRRVRSVLKSLQVLDRCALSQLPLSDGLRFAWMERCFSHFSRHHIHRDISMDSSIDASGIIDDDLYEHEQKETKEELTEELTEEKLEEEKKNKKKSYEKLLLMYAPQSEEGAVKAERNIKELKVCTVDIPMEVYEEHTIRCLRESNRQEEKYFSEKAACWWVRFGEGIGNVRVRISWTELVRVFVVVHTSVAHGRVRSVCGAMTIECVKKRKERIQIQNALTSDVRMRNGIAQRLLGDIELYAAPEAARKVLQAASQHVWKLRVGSEYSACIFTTARNARGAELMLRVRNELAKQGVIFKLFNSKGIQSQVLTSAHKAQEDDGARGSRSGRREREESP